MHHKLTGIIILLLAVAFGGYSLWEGGTDAAATIGSDNPSFQADLKNILDLQAGVGGPTFTRADGADRRATVTDFEGLIKPVKQNEARFEGARRVENLATYSEDFSNWSASAPPVVVTTNQVAAPNGTQTADLIDTTGADNSYLSQSIGSTFAVGTQCLFSIYLRSVSGTGTFPINIFDGSNHHRTFVNLTTSWQRFTLTTTVVTAGVNACNVYPVDTRSGQGSLTQAYAWGGQAENVTGQSNQNPSEYISTGVLSAPYHGANVDGVKYFTTQNGNTVASNVVTEATGAAIADSTLHGYLAEGSRTNLLTYNSDQSNAIWAAGNVSISTDTTVDPSGTNSADTITETGGLGTHRTYYNGANVSSGATATFSVYLKAGTRRYVGLSITNGASEVYAVVDTQTWTITQTGAASGGVYVASSVQSASNGFYRVSVTGSITGQTSYFPLISGSDVATPGGITGYTYTGSGSTWIVWGAQLEQASFASSYIPTTSATVMRAADFLSYPSSGNMLPGVGSVYTEASRAEITATKFLVTSVNNSYLGGIELDALTGTRFNVSSDSGSTETDIQVGAAALNTVQKYAARWATNSAQAYFNGSKGTEDTTVTVPTTIRSTIDIGDRPTGPAPLFGTIRNVKIWKKALTDAQLQNLTSGSDAVSHAAVKKSTIKRNGTATTTINASQNTKLTNGLVGLWSFNGPDVTETAIHDRSGQGNNGSFIGGATSSAKTIGKVGQALSFDGVDDYVSAPNSASLQPLSGNWSVTFWIYRIGTGNGDYPQVVGSRPWADNIDKGWAVSYETSTGKVAGHYADGSTGFDVPDAQGESVSTVSLNTWEHWAVIFDRTSGQLRFYKDGILDATRTPSFPSGSINQTNPLYMGREIEGSNIRKLNAKLDEVRIYNRTLSAAEILQLYNLGR